MNHPPNEFLVRLSTDASPPRDVMTTPNYQFARKVALRRLGPTGADQYGQPSYSAISFGDKVLFEARRTNIRDDPLDKLEHVKNPDGTVTTRGKPADQRSKIWDVEITKEVLP